MKEQLPKEAPIYINIGKIYKKFGKIKEALENFNIALDLDPKDINQVKNLIKNIASKVLHIANNEIIGNGIEKVKDNNLVKNIG